MSNELSILAAGPDLAEAMPDATLYLRAVMERAKQRLAREAARGHLDQVAALRSDAESIRAWANIHVPGAELDCAEVVRRAEREVGKGIRAGQAAGTIRPPRAHVGNQYSENHDDSRMPPTIYATKGELMGGGGDGYGGSKPGFYHLADGITDEEFEAALAAGRAEKNLTRMNLWRRLRPIHNGDGWIPEINERGGEASIRRREVIREMAAAGNSSRQIGETLGVLDGTVRRIAREEGVDIPADKTISKTLRHNNDRIVEETTHILEGAVMGLALVDPGELDQSQVKDWAASLRKSTRDINRFVKTITSRETAQ